jgi:ABC-2 type transport system permease protein
MQVWKIMKWEFANRVKTKLFIITTFLLPFFMGGIMYLPSLLMDLEPDENKVIGLKYPDVNMVLVKRFEDRASLSLKLKNGQSEFSFIRFNDDESAVNAIKNKKITGYLDIPIGILDTAKAKYFSNSLSNIKIYTNLRRLLNKVVVEQRMINQKIDTSLVEELIRKINFGTYELDELGEASQVDEFSSFLVPYLFLMILFGTIFMSGQLLLRSVMEERTSRTIEILLSSVTPDELMRGKIFGLGALGLMQMLFYLLIALTATHYKGMAIIELSQIPLFLIFFTTGYFFYASIFAAMGTFFTSEQEAQQSSGMISIIAVLPIAFASYFITNPESVFTIGISYIPPLTPFIMIIRIGTDSVGSMEVFYTSLLMIISCLFMLKFSGKVFRTAILLYGKKITFNEVRRWITS